MARVAGKQYGRRVKRMDAEGESKTIHRWAKMRSWASQAGRAAQKEEKRKFHTAYVRMATVQQVARVFEFVRGSGDWGRSVCVFHI